MEQINKVLNYISKASFHTQALKKHRVCSFLGSVVSAS